jgi:hypothetical protein
MKQGVVFTRRWGGRHWIGLALCYLLLANALLSASAGAQWEIAQADPLRLAVLTSLCHPEGDDTSPAQGPSHHQLDCGFCCVACPTGGTGPAVVADAALFELAPMPAAPAFFNKEALPDGDGRLYPSDIASQAPPLAAIRA